MSRHPTRAKNLGSFWLIVAVAVAGVLVAVSQRSAPLTPTEASCVGSWAFHLPEKTTTLIVYHFASDRRVREEHYYLGSAWPTVPRLTMRGRWSLDSGGRMTVEPSGGIGYLRDSLSGWLNEYFDDGRQGWPRPILTRFYDVVAVTSESVVVAASRTGGGRLQITMVPFTGDPASVPAP